MVNNGAVRDSSSSDFKYKNVLLCVVSNMFLVNKYLELERILEAR